MNMIHRLACAAVAVLVLVSSGEISAAEISKLPNVVVFLVDDMGVMDTSVPFLTDENGKPKSYPLNEYYRTPNMERLAKKGTRFNNFYAMSVCSPTRISIMTGQNAARHRTTTWINPERDNRGPNGPLDWNWKGLKKGDVTLPGVLQKMGYDTIHVGKGHFGPTEAEGGEPLNLGFVHNIGGWSIGAPGSYYGEQHYGNLGKRKNRGVPHLEKYHGSDTFLSEALTIEAKERVMTAVSEDRPFYLYMSHYAVHAPFNSDSRFADHYTESGKPKNAQAFATLIEGMDKSLGDILDHIEKLGVAENTLVMFLGDNGSDAPLGDQHAVACAAPLRGKKGAHYEGGMRVPFIAAWAKANPKNEYQQKLPIAVNAIQSQQAAVMDIFPTVASLVGAKVPKSHKVDGRKLDTLLTGKNDSSRDERFLMHFPHSPHRSTYFTVLREGNWKVIYHYFPNDKATKKQSEGSQYQLYNLADDPFEQTNLAKTHPEELKTMMQKLITQLEGHQALYPVDPADGKTPVKPKLP